MPSKPSPQAGKPGLRTFIENQMQKSPSKSKCGQGTAAPSSGKVPPPISTDPIFQQYGPPFLTGEKGDTTLNNRAIAAKCAAVYKLKYDANAKCFESYNPSTGLWVRVDQLQVERALDHLIAKLAEAVDDKELVWHLTAAKLGSIIKTMRSHDIRVELVHTEGLVHAPNGIIDLRANKVGILAHDPKYPFKHSSNVPYDKDAKPSKFLNDFLGVALEASDISLLQKYCGSILLGPNTCHGILVIRGTPGGGKSTLVSIIEKIIGEANVAQLRTSHLSGRFETSAFIGKRLLVGKDVPGETLAEAGARMLKSLVGGDLMQAEIKFNPDKQSIRGDYHVMIVSNNNLRVALDGDKDAWARRLLVVDFKNPKPTHPIPDYASQLVAEEQSGILNWMIAGALAYRNEMKTHGRLQLTDGQKSRVENLLQDSDNVTEFVQHNLAPKEGGDVTSDELLLCYYKQCASRNWTPVASQTFFTRVPDLLAQLFKATRRNDIQREGKAVRGYKNLALV